jgi:hypothetical protein
MQIAIPDGWLRSIVLMRLVYSPSNSSAQFGGLRVCCEQRRETLGIAARHAPSAERQRLIAGRCQRESIDLVP